MHDGRFLHVPIVSTDADTEEETVIGILDVLDCAVHTLSRFTHSEKSPHASTETEDHDYIYNTKVNSEADRAMFTSLFLREDTSELSSSGKAVSVVKSGVHNEISINDSVSQSGFKSAINQAGTEVSQLEKVEKLQLKIKGVNGNIYRAKVQLSGLTLSNLESKLFSVVGNLKNQDIFYLDEDGDEILLSTESCLESALSLATSSTSLKLTIMIKNTVDNSQAKNNNVLVALSVGSLIGLLGVAIYALSRQPARSDTFSRNNYHTYNRYR